MRQIPKAKFENCANIGDQIKALSILLLENLAADFILSEIKREIAEAKAIAIKKIMGK